MVDVSTPTKQYNACAKAWKRSDDLWGGTQSMRDAGKEYLPREEAETEVHYTNRLHMSVLFNGYRDGVTRISSKPFSRAITLTGAEALDPRLQAIEADCDRRGTSITQFGRELLEDGLRYGVAHFIVDYPKTFARKTSEGPQEVPASQARYDEEGPNAVRPYFARVCPTDAIEVSDVRVRVKETECVSDGEWGTKEIDQVRVYAPGEWAIHTKTDKDYAEQASGTTPLDSLPTVSTYLRRKLDHYAEPVMEDLIWLNIAHWQSASDQRNLLHVARVPILYETGVNATDIKQKLEIGSTAVRRTAKSPQEADLKWVEPTGGALGAGASDIKDLERRMEVLGVQPFIRQTGSATATEKALDESNVDSDVQTWIRLIETALMRGYELAAQWINKTLPETFEIDIWNEFGLSMSAPTNADIIGKANAAGVVDDLTYAQELQRYGILSNTINVKEMVDRARNQAPDLAGMGDEDGEIPPSDPDPKDPDEADEEDEEPEREAA